MKRCIYIALLLGTFTCCHAQETSRPKLRSMYMQAIQRRSALDSLISLLDKVKSPSPAEQSYLGICQAVLIQYVNGNWEKYKLLGKSKSLLNRAIERAPHDPELRFMRFTLEHYLPAFLCMSIHLKEDLSVIAGEPLFLEESPDLKKMAMEFILSSNRCDETLRSRFERALFQLNRKLLTASKN
jgi:hypothetical protein